MTVRTVSHLVARASFIVAAWVADAACAQPAPGPAIQVRAQLVPEAYTTLSAEVSAKVISLPVREGSSFKAGDLLVQLDATIPQAQLKRAKAELMAARALFETNTKLHALNSVGRLELDQAAAAVDRAQADVDAAQAVVDRCAITAPYDGRLARLAIREFQSVQPGQPLVEILDDRSLEMEFIAPSVWLKWIRPGSQLVLTVDETGSSYPAQISRIGARIDPVSQTINLTAVIDGRFPELLAGMTGEVTPVSAP